MHPSHVTQYDEFVAGSRKRKKDNITYFDLNSIQFKNK